MVEFVWSGRSMYLPAALQGIEASFLASDSLRKLPLFVVLFGLVVNLWLVLVLSLACWMGPLGVTCILCCLVSVPFAS